jgi:integrase/recombinase XerD
MTKTYLDQTEIDALKNAASCRRDRLLITILQLVGCRISEAVGIQVSDIDLDRGVLRIEHLKTRLQATCPRCSARLGRKHTFCPGCGEKVEAVVTRAREHKRMRELPLRPETILLIKEHIASGGPVEKDRKVLLFGIGRHRAWQIIRECAEKAGLSDLVNPDTGKERGVSPHRLRDAFAVNAMKVDPTVEGARMLQQQLGHSSFDTTARYRKISEDEHRAWYQRLWDRFKKE